MTRTNPDKITPEEWRTAAKVARRSIFGNSELADAWENVAKYSAAADLTTELAKAYRAAENAVAPIQCEWDQLPEDYQEFGRVGIRGVLEFLTSADRLLADDEMRLTAEQVEDVKIVLGQLERGGPAFEAAHERLRALVPATEPAEVISRYQTMQRGFAAKHFGFPANPVFEDRYTAPDGGKWQWTDELQWELRCYPPAPAVPAGEETKAEPWIVQLPEGMTMEQWIESLPDEAPGLLAAVREVRERLGISSPVVPAPTETGPWKHRVNGEICVASPASGLPYTIGKFNDHGDFVWHSSSAELPEGFAPFVAAEEG